MRKILCVSALLLAFCCPALGGEIPNPPAPPPPPAPIEETTPTDQSTTTAADDDIYGTEADTLTQFVLSLFTSVLP